MHHKLGYKMNSSKGLILDRRNEAIARLTKLKNEIQTLESLQQTPALCSYVTGSCGRLEAAQTSNLDLFFIHNGNSKSSPIQWLDKTLLDADLIRLVKRLNFPDFSNDGEYLVVHHVDDIKEALGGRNDDYKNFFTARLLLLLESQPVHNKKVYNSVLKEIISSYYRDYHEHETNFQPVFLINDIIRFWRTLCLNYEHKRQRPENDHDRKKRVIFRI